MTHASAGHAAGHTTHNPEPMKQLGLWLFIISESCLFSSFIASRYYLTGLDRPEHLNQLLGLAITAVLLLSSLTAYRAETAMSHGDLAGFKSNMLWTLLLGLGFVGGVTLEWYEAFHVPELLPQTVFGSLFFSITGLHAFHVISGLVILALVARFAAAGRFGPGNNWGVEASVKYWHFVDVAWVFIYPTLYLVN